ncbi:hypothetical protein GF359_04130 [candidate division WOR-3 bacterium]|uniref:Cell division protein ZapB n=1 Tax=candidate division WOR-3 bacterium TaxID=2052148 RepID=A0A9D5KAR7_UNCW3|nr:hypothetical protein [candidate division WOR-3 bacterium]MBD3364386.1 hypothetical protein [candidate division WOR-3 bacterium]
MEAEYKELSETIGKLIQRVRELETECKRLTAENDELKDIRKAAAQRITTILDRLEEPE